MKAEDIKVLNVDDVPYAVDQLPEDIKELIDIFNMWNRDEVDARLALMKVQAAKRDLSRSIIDKVRKMKTEGDEAEGHGNDTEAVNEDQSRPDAD